MSNQVPLLLTDIADLSTTPKIVTTSATVGTNVSMSPAGPDKPGSGVFVFEDRSGGIQSLYPRYTLSVRKPQAGGKNLTVTEKFVLPVPNVTAPSTGLGIQSLSSVAYNLTYEASYTLPASCSLAERTKFLSLLLGTRARTIEASDGSPGGITSTPLYDAILSGEPLY